MDIYVPSERAKSLEAQPAPCCPIKRSTYHAGRWPATLDSSLFLSHGELTVFNQSCFLLPRAERTLTLWASDSPPGSQAQAAPPPPAPPSSPESSELVSLFSSLYKEEVGGRDSATIDFFATANTGMQRSLGLHGSVRR